jgi:hypothetical protein
MNERRTDPEPTGEFERSAKDAFDASVRELDAATRQRLVQARERALEDAGGARLGLGWSWSFAPAGAVAAAALVAVLLIAHRERPMELGAQQLAPGDLEILLGQADLAMLDDDIEFYSWLEDQPELGPAGANGDGVG